MQAQLSGISSTIQRMERLLDDAEAQPAIAAVRGILREPPATSTDPAPTRTAGGARAAAPSKAATSVGPSRRVVGGRAQAHVAVPVDAQGVPLRPQSEVLRNGAASRGASRRQERTQVRASMLRALDDHCTFAPTINKRPVAARSVSQATLDDTGSVVSEVGPSKPRAARGGVFDRLYNQRKADRAPDAASRSTSALTSAASPPPLSTIASVHAPSHYSHGHGHGPRPLTKPTAAPHLTRPATSAAVSKAKPAPPPVRTTPPPAASDASAPPASTVFSRLYQRAGERREQQRLAERRGSDGPAAHHSRIGTSTAAVRSEGAPLHVDPHHRPPVTPALQLSKLRRTASDSSDLMPTPGGTWTRLSESGGSGSRVPECIPPLKMDLVIGHSASNSEVY